MLLKALMISYLVLVALDSAATYVGIRHFGLVETWPSRGLFDYYGLTLGIAISTAFCFSIAWSLWKVRRLKMAAYSGLLMLALTELAAAINNVSAILHTVGLRSLVR